jgi:hypothetical protein
LGSAELSAGVDLQWPGDWIEAVSVGLVYRAAAACKRLRND